MLIEISPGRTTFVNTLCGKKVLHAKEADDAASAHLEEGVRIKPVTVGEQPAVRWAT
jgi:cell division control protein 11